MQVFPQLYSAAGASLTEPPCSSDLLPNVEIVETGPREVGIAPLLLSLAILISYNVLYFLNLTNEDVYCLAIHIS